MKISLDNIRDYTVGVLSGYFKNKNQLDKISESKSGNLIYNGSEIKNVNININNNTDQLDYCELYVSQEATINNGELIPFNSVACGNMSYNLNNYSVNLKANKVYNILFSVHKTDINSLSFPLFFNITDNVALENSVSESLNHADSVNTTFISCVIETDKEFELGVIQNGRESININYATLQVHEIGRIIDPIEYVNKNNGLEDTPIGHILTHMGTKAPKHYLICDGSMYNILDYPYLARHILDDFGSYNYFGGDGETTFAVPDLRGEFLRGTGVATRNSGAGASVGEHQAPTQSFNFYLNKTPRFGVYYNNKNLQNNPNSKTVAAMNYDKAIEMATDYYAINQTSVSTLTTNEVNYYTSRPTNTAVLYCIKYEPTYFINLNS